MLAVLRKFFLVTFFGIVILAAPVSTQSAEEIPVELKGVGITEHLGDTIPLDLEFRDETGNLVTLGKYIDGDLPVILTLVYYECPNLCTLLLNGLISSLEQMKWSVGSQFKIVTVTINPAETFELAAEKKEAYLEKYGRENTGPSWHFLTGTEENIKKLTDAVGFGYRYDEDQKEFAHSAAIFVLSPDGKISRYLYGITFRPKDLKLALLEAGKGKIGNVVDRLLLFCYHYDPKGRKYALFATNLMKGAGILTILGLGIIIIRSGKRKKGSTKA